MYRKIVSCEKRLGVKEIKRTPRIWVSPSQLIQHDGDITSKSQGSAYDWMKPWLSKQQADRHGLASRGAEVGAGQIGRAHDEASHCSKDLTQSRHQDSTTPTFC